MDSETVEKTVMETYRMTSRVHDAIYGVPGTMDGGMIQDIKELRQGQGNANQRMEKIEKHCAAMHAAESTEAVGPVDTTAPRRRMAITRREGTVLGAAVAIAAAVTAVCQVFS